MSIASRNNQVSTNAFNSSAVSGDVSTNRRSAVTAASPRSLSAKSRSTQCKIQFALNASAKDSVLRFERRSEPRTPVNADSGVRELSATYSDHDQRFGIANLTIVDQSRQGLGVLTNADIQPGMSVTICPPGSTIPWIHARAVRTHSQPDGLLRVGLALSRRQAA